MPQESQTEQSNDVTTEEVQSTETVTENDVDVVKSETTDTTEASEEIKVDNTNVEDVADQKVDSESPEEEAAVFESDELSDEESAEFGSYFKDQDSLDKFTDSMKEIQARNEERSKQEKAEWKEDLKKDESFGKNYEENIEKVQSLASELGGDFDNLLSETGYINNPVVAKALLKIAAERSDAKVIAPDNKSYSSKGITYSESGTPLLDMCKE